MAKDISYVLFEDEYYTSASLKSTIADFRPNYRLVGESETVAQATSILGQQHPDLVISSMLLADGCCIDAFRLSQCRKPTIIMAERKADNASGGLNVIDYLLKPVSADSIRRSILKFEQIIDNQ